MIVRSGLFAAPVRHGFFTREGGVSGGIFASLNCSLGSGDDLAAVAENRCRAMAELGLGLDALASVYQVHSPDVVMVEQPWPYAERPKADAMVTKRKGVALGIEAREAALLKNASPEQQAAIRSGCRRLIEPAEMGTLFKVLALTQKGGPVPAGFGAAP